MTTSTFVFDLSATLESAAAAYAAADQSGKAHLRSDRVAAMTAAVKSGNIELAMHLADLEPALSVPKSSTPAVDYVTVVANLRATLVQALAAIDNRDGIVLPEGVTVDWPEELPTGTADMTAARKLVTLSGRKSGRGNVAAYVDSVLGDDPMTVAQLRGAWVASEDYPNEPPTSGAIAAMLDRDGGTDLGFAVTTIGGVKGAKRS